MPFRHVSRFDLTIAAALAGFGLSSVFGRTGVNRPRETAESDQGTEDAALVAWRRELDPDAAPVAAPANPIGAWGIATRVFWNISEHRLLTEAAGVTFYALLALFPALAALISLYGLIATPASLSDELNAANGLVPGGGMDIIHEQLKSLTRTDSGTLSFAAVLGPLTALWSANSGTKSMFDALNVVYGEKEQRGYVRRTLISLALTFGALIFLIISLGAVVALPIVLGDLGLSAISNMLLQVLRWPLLFVIITVLLDVLYRFGPSRTYVRWRWITWGGSASAMSWIVISLAFSWYLANFNSFNRTYGSLGAAIGFMTWIWISSIIVLVGAELDAALEQSRSTSKAGKPS